MFEVYPPNGWRHCRLTSAQRLANTAACFGLLVSAALHSSLSHFPAHLAIPPRFREDPSAVISVILAAFSQLTGKFASEWFPSLQMSGVCPLLYRVHRSDQIYTCHISDRLVRVFVCIGCYLSNTKKLLRTLLYRSPGSVLVATSGGKK